MRDNIVCRTEGLLVYNKGVVGANNCTEGNYRIGEEDVKFCVVLTMRYMFTYTDI